MKEISGHSNKNEKAFREATNEEEDGDCSSAKVCRCEMCPDLSRDVSFTCCRNVSKAHSICIQENLSCICFAKKIEKLLDKASPCTKKLQSIHEFLFVGCFRGHAFRLF